MRLAPLAACAIACLALWSLFSALGRPPDIILITIDTLRPDRLGAYGHPTNQTPAIDGLAREGVLFERAYCDIPWTTGSMASVMTGLYGPRHGVQLPTHRLRPAAVTLAELLSAHGYQTAAIIGSFPLDSVYGLDQGFETYDDEFTHAIIETPGKAVGHIESQLPQEDLQLAAFVMEKLMNDAYRPDEAVTDVALRWLEERRDGRPFFLWVHYFGPHEKLRMGVNVVDQETAILAAYDDDVEANDRAVGRLLDGLHARDLLRPSLLVLHADHGQSLGEHDYVGHGLDLYDVVVRIPLIVHYPPRVRGGTRVRGITRNVDLLPTMLKAAHVRLPRGLDGRSLFGGGHDGAAYFETHAPTLVLVVTHAPDGRKILGPLTLRGLRTPEWKLIVGNVGAPCAQSIVAARDPFGAHYLENPTPLPDEQCRAIEPVELYPDDAAEAPATNQVAAQPAVLAAMREGIAAHARTPELRDEFVLSPEQERKLRSLGYLQ